MGSVGNMESVNSPISNTAEIRHLISQTGIGSVCVVPLSMRAAPLSVSGRAVAAAGRLGQFIALGQVLVPAG